MPETLMHWQHPLLGAARPDGFTPMPEWTELMHERGSWILGEVVSGCEEGAVIYSLQQARRMVQQLSPWARRLPSTIPVRGPPVCPDSAACHSTRSRLVLRSCARL